MKIGGGRLVVPVVGRRADPESAILEALEAAVPNGRRRMTGALAALKSASEEGKGVLLIIDEMGKFLEHVANTGEGDVYFFQQLAEEASRSKGKLLVVCILHQAFDDYAHRLAREVRDEWMKIQGRFSDIPLNIAADEQVELISRAIEVKDGRPSFPRAEKLASALRRANADLAAISGRLAHCWPLDPAVALLLGPLSRRRFGQSQRSIFGFLNSAEPFGFQSYLGSAPEDGSETYGLSRLWDYLRANLEPSILASPDGHRWALAVDALERCEARGADVEHSDVVKCVALIDLFKERSGLVASRAVLEASLPGLSAKKLTEVLDHLSSWSVVIHKKHLDAFSIYAGSDFDIEAAVLEARGKMTGIDFGRLKSVAALQPILAKRFYHRTGALIWFDVDIVALVNAVDAMKSFKPANGSAGVFLLLMGTEAEGDPKGRKVAKDAARASVHPAACGWTRKNYLLRESAMEMLALEAVRAGRAELNGDAVARREIDARIARAVAEFEDKLRDAFASAEWFSNADELVAMDAESDTRNGAVTLNLLASKLAESTFGSMPIIHNELLNRIKPSSNANAAMKALLRAMVDHHAQDRLGFEGWPAEAGLYSALIARPGLHRRQKDGSFRFVAPDYRNRAGLLDLWKEANDLFDAPGSAQVSMSDVFARWRNRPFGVRDGLLPVLGIAYILSQISHLSIYLDGVYQVKLTSILVDRLMQDASSVRLRWSDLSDLQRDALVGLSEVVSNRGGFPDGLSSPSPLDTAKGLVRLVTELPTWVMRTASLPPEAVQIRNLAKSANDPNKFLLDDLPESFGGKAGGRALAALVDKGLKALLEAYPGLLANLEDVMLRELRVRNRTAEALEDLKGRAAVIRNLTGDYRLDAFATRLATYDFAAIDREAIEGIASLAAGKPARDWVDRDVDQARIEIAALAQQFVKAEGFAHVKGRVDRRLNVAIYTSDFMKNAPLRAEVDVTSTDAVKVQALAKRLKAIFDEEGVESDVAFAVVAELGALYSKPAPPVPASKRKSA